MPFAATVLDLDPAAASARVEQWAAEHRLPAYRARQIARRLWVAPIARWDDASELPSALRLELDQTMPLPRLTAAVVQQSVDGTRKHLWTLPDGEQVESVLIPSGKRRTLCISSQAGCALGCVFCATGRMGFRRNLSPWEIAAQVRDIVIADPADKPTNIVFMGMGEPLLNWDAVNVVLSILNHPEGFGIGARHITVSTVGIVPGMLALAQRPEQFRLAISLHAADPTTRHNLMPIEKKYPLKAVLDAAATFRRRITFEYVVIAGRNDSDEAAIALASLARRLGAHVNLLPLHPGGVPDLVPADAKQLAHFRDLLTVRGVEAVVRRSRGLDIDAACGQLRVNTERKRRAAVG